MRPPAHLLGRIQERKNGPSHHFFLEKAVPSALILMTDNSTPPYMLREPFQLLLQHWSSEEVWDDQCEGPLRGPSDTPNLSAAIPSGFYSQKLWGLLILALAPCLGGLVWVWNSLLLRGYLGHWYIPSDFNQPHKGEVPAHSVSLPFLLVLMWLLIYVLSYRTLI